MNLSHRVLRRATLVLVLAGTALATGLHAAPTTFASNPPVITATSPGPAGVYVTGRHFTPGGRVQIEVTDQNYSNAAYVYTTASRTLGRIRVGFNVLPCWQTDHVQALDEHTGQYSNWANVYVYCVQ